jgi:hypothetical protein
MRLLKSVLAGLLVVMVGMFTAAVIAVSAAAIFIGRRLRGGKNSEEASPMRAGTPPRRMSSAGGVIDVEATEVPSVIER